MDHESQPIDPLTVIENICQRRRTVKVLANEPFPAHDRSVAVEQLMRCAGWAPFHKVCAVEHRGEQPLNGIQPWRFHALAATECRKLRGMVLGFENVGKIPAMLAAADSLVLATWLPNPSTNQYPPESEAFEPTLANVEHIAAASAAVQSLLLAATAADFETYWSSGGVLRSPTIFQKLAIPASERLLGAIFLFPPELPANYDAEIAESKLRPQRSPLNAWSRWVTVSSLAICIGSLAVVLS